MAVPSFIRRELRSAKVYFIPNGETVGAVTVSDTTWPTASPVTNYTSYEIPDIETLSEEIEQQDEEFLVPTPTGGYRNQPETHLLGKSWLLTTAKTSSYLKQLQHALALAPTTGTAHSPGTRGLLFLDGVMLLEIVGITGGVIERVQVASRMTLVSPGETGPATARVQVRFRQRHSGNNTYVALNP